MQYNPELILDCKYMIGEGTLWHPETKSLYFIDLLGNKIGRLNITNGDFDEMECGQNTGCIALSYKYDLIAAMQHGFYYVDFHNKKMVAICDPEKDKPNNRFNDGKVGPDGSFYAGTMSKDLDSGYGSYEPHGKLYRLDTHYNVDVIDNAVIISNGLAWTKDESVMYHVDTPTFQIKAYDYDKSTGKASNGRMAFKIPEHMGGPDGMTIDEEDMLWICHWGGSAVNRWNPKTGELVESIAMPVSQPTCCAFGGEDMDDLFITSASINTKNEPYAGGIFKVKLNVKGRRSYTFND